MSLKDRVLRLEEYRRRRLPLDHFVSVVHIPWELPVGMDEETWLRTEVTCACGQQGCPETRFGLVVPEKAPLAEAWQAATRRFYETHPRS
jgi:hypothetical protein